MSNMEQMLAKAKKSYGDLPVHLLVGGGFFCLVGDKDRKVYFRRKEFPVTNHAVNKDGTISAEVILLDPKGRVDILSQTDLDITKIEFVE